MEHTPAPADPRPSGEGAPPGVPAGVPAEAPVRYDLGRLRSLSDCVFAVAITLLAGVAAAPAPGSSAAAVDQFLADEVVGYAAFVAAFVLIGYVWLLHHRIFGLLHRVDGWTVWLNFAALSLLVLLPYLGRLSSDFTSFGTPHLLVGVDVFAVGVLLLVVVRHCRRSGLFAPVVPPAAVRILSWRPAVLAVAFGAAGVASLLRPGLAALGWPLLVGGGVVLRVTLGRIDQADVGSIDDQVHIDADEAPVGARPGERQLSSISRITGFSDNVYAFAITILALQLHVPSRSLVHTDAQLVHELRVIADPTVTGYLLGFVILGVFWVAHCRYFLLIDRHGPSLPAFNLGHLMTVAVLPFATLLFSDFPISSTTVVYAVAAGCAGTSLSLLLSYAIRHRLTADTLDRVGLRRARLQSAIMPLGFFASVPLAVVAPRAAWVVWLVVGFSGRRLVRSTTV